MASNETGSEDSHTTRIVSQSFSGDEDVSDVSVVPDTPSPVFGSMETKRIKLNNGQQRKSLRQRKVKYEEDKFDEDRYVGKPKVCNKKKIFDLLKARRSKSVTAGKKLDEVSSHLDTSGERKTDTDADLGTTNKNITDHAIDSDSDFCDFMPKANSKLKSKNMKSKKVKVLSFDSESDSSNELPALPNLNVEKQTVENLDKNTQRKSPFSSSSTDFMSLDLAESAAPKVMEKEEDKQATEMNQETRNYLRDEKEHGPEQHESPSEAAKTSSVLETPCESTKEKLPILEQIRKEANYELLKVGSKGKYWENFKEKKDEAEHYDEGSANLDAALGDVPKRDKAPLVNLRQALKHFSKKTKSPVVNNTPTQRLLDHELKGTHSRVENNQALFKDGSPASLENAKREDNLAFISKKKAKQKGIFVKEEKEEDLDLQSYQDDRNTVDCNNDSFLEHLKGLSRFGRKGGLSNKVKETHSSKRQGLYKKKQFKQSTKKKANEIVENTGHGTNESDSISSLKEQKAKANKVMADIAQGDHNESFREMLAVQYMCGQLFEDEGRSNETQPRKILKVKKNKTLGVPKSGPDTPHNTLEFKAPASERDFSFLPLLKSPYRTSQNASENLYLESTEEGATSQAGKKTSKSKTDSTSTDLSPYQGLPLDAGETRIDETSHRRNGRRSSKRTKNIPSNGAFCTAADVLNAQSPLETREKRTTKRPCASSADVTIIGTVPGSRNTNDIEVIEINDGPENIAQQYEDDEMLAKRLQEEMDLEYAQVLANTATPTPSFHPGMNRPVSPDYSLIGAAFDEYLSHNVMQRSPRRGRRERRNAIAHPNRRGFGHLILPFYPEMRFSAEEDNDYESLLRLAEQIGEVKKRGMTKKQISHLPIKTFKMSEIKDKDSIPECSVCMCEFTEGDKIRIIPCFHEFHAACIEKWIKENATCPVCREPVKT